MRLKNSKIAQSIPFSALKCQITKKNVKVTILHFFPDYNNTYIKKLEYFILFYSWLCFALFVILKMNIERGKIIKAQMKKSHILNILCMKDPN